jgi:hypothetical protein
MFEVFNFFKFKDDHRASSSGLGCAHGENYNQLVFELYRETSKRAFETL